ncbi:hypothetical protein [Mesorhizobium sp. Z1-4]|uniref:hypothetical protein n=1 Tax=Mesorhizobium sp. Z1-4 TaxID=2448478 RepID=UPI0013DED159|nr:hypothetical protein [Mesorhizobium sp. Z1-4]
MNAPVEPPRLSDCGPLWQRMIDGLADMQADLLRRLHERMDEAREREATPTCRENET